MSTEISDTNQGVQQRSAEEVYAIVDNLGITDDVQIVETVGAGGVITTETAINQSEVETQPETGTTETDINTDTETTTNIETQPEQQNHSDISTNTDENQSETVELPETKEDIKDSTATINTDIDGTSDEGSTTNILTEQLKELGIDSSEKVEELYKGWLEKDQLVSEYEKSKDVVQLASENNLTVKDLAILAEAKKGNVAAITELLKNADLDVTDLIEDEPSELDIDKYTEQNNSDILLDRTKLASTYAVKIGAGEQFSDILSTWEPSAVGDLVAKDENLNIVLNDIKSGAFEEISKTMQKLKNSDFTGKFKNSDSLDLYAIAKTSLNGTTQNQDETPVQQVTEEQKTKTEVKLNEANSVEKQTPPDTESTAEELAKQAAVFKSTNSNVPSAGTQQGSSQSSFDTQNDLFSYIDGLVDY